MRPIFLLHYEGQKGEGKKVNESNQPHAQWTPSVPTSISYLLGKWVCAYKP